MPDQIQLQFIEDQLRQYGVDVQEAMDQAIGQLDAVDSGALRQSVRFRVLKATANNQGAVQILFREHGRYLDMGTGRGGRAQTAAVRRSRRTNARGGNGRQPKKFYSPVAYGFLSTLIGRLSFGFTQDYIRALKSAEA